MTTPQVNHLTPDERLLSAVEDEDVEAVSQALRDGADVNLACDGRTPLWTAVAMCDAEDDPEAVVVRLLISAGANVNTSDRSETTALMNARWHPTVASLLLGAGADLHATDSGGSTALHGAAHDDCVEVLRLLVEAGAEVHAPGGLGPLFSAALGNACNTASLLISMGVDVTVRDEDGRTALDLAIENQTDHVQGVLRAATIAAEQAELRATADRATTAEHRGRKRL